MTDLWIEKYQKQALPKLKEEFKPEKIIIFGSRVKGSSGEDSDIDIIVISSCFANISFLKRMPLVIKKVPFPKHVDYICYTPEEFDRIKEESSVVIDALENSIEITQQ